ncbi:SWP2 [Symbiodinium sp. CCMP2592]|nr:SWP2 [Symbiodinium sp. CCMP2592]
MVEVPLSEAVASYRPKLSVASLGAIERKDGSYRAAHDGTHGVNVNVNAKIKLRDQLRNPTAGDLCTVLKYMPRAAFGLTSDIKRAHRLAKGSRTRLGPPVLSLRLDLAEQGWDVWNCSAAYHWSRLMGGLGRQKGGVTKIILAVFIYVLLGVPFAWKKFVGGSEFTWVGFSLNLRIGALGLSESRAAWAINWLESTAMQGLVRVADMRAALGRLSFALSALGHSRPFLGPMYAWVAVLHNCRRYQVPKAIVLIMQYLAKALKGLGRLTPVGTPVACEKELFRTDAKAEVCR